MAEPSPQPERRSLPQRGIFVGRQREMAELAAALDDALAGQGRLVMLAGEPGIGKTRTAQQLAALAEQRGAQVLWGWCYEEQGAPPYWPWVQLIRTYVQDIEPERLRKEMGPGAADIAEIIPYLRQKIPDLETPPELGAEQARFRLFDSVTTFLKNAARTHPLTMVLDDVHWADRSTLLLLEFLAKEISASPVLLVGTYRDSEISTEHPLSRTLGTILREQHFKRVAMEGLTQAEVGEFIEGNAGVSLPINIVEAVHGRTAGNPLFIGEMVRLLDKEEPSSLDGWSAAIPEGVREVIGRRLSRLSDICNQVLTTASVMGREFSLPLLDRLADDLPEERLLELVEEALDAGVITEMPGSVEHYQFTHAVIRDALASRFSASRRARLHGAIGQAMEEMYGDQAEVHAAELAHHFAEAEPILGTGKLVRYSLLAGERALAAYAQEEALAHFERGLVAKGVPLTGLGPATDEEAAALLFGLARAQAATVESSRQQELVDTLWRAFEYYSRTGDVDKVVAVAESPTYRVVNTVEPGGLSQIFTRALAIIPPRSHEAGRIAGIYGLFLGVRQDDYVGAQEALGMALSIAQREGDKILEMQALEHSAHVDNQHLRYQEGLEKNLKGIELARRLNDPGAEAGAHYAAVTNLINTGDLEGGRLHATAMLPPAERMRDRNWLAGALWKNALVFRLAGDWDTAREFSDRGLALLSQHSNLLSDRIILESEVGEVAQSDVYLERLAELMRLTPSGTAAYSLTAALAPLAARISCTTDKLNLAEAASETVLSSPSAIPLHVTRARAGIALIAVQRGDSNAAEEQYAALLTLRGVMLSTGLISIDRLLGLLSQTMGNLDQAATHFDDALAFCRKAGYRPELAWTCCDYADALRERDAEGDRAMALALLDEALAVSTELGMRPLITRVTERVERIQAQPSTVGAYPDGLTRREVEVLALAAAGKSNADIAEALVISPNTVVRHVSNILAKTGSSNRTEAAAYATRQGLLSW